VHQALGRGDLTIDPALADAFTVRALAHEVKLAADAQIDLTLDELPPRLTVPAHQ
jgi:hypothetical protein